MADKKFGVKQIDLIGASGTPTLTSPNNLNINAINVAISTDLSVGGDVSNVNGTTNTNQLVVSGISTLGASTVFTTVDNLGNIGIGTNRAINDYSGGNSVLSIHGRTWPGNPTVAGSGVLRIYSNQTLLGSIYGSDLTGIGYGREFNIDSAVPMSISCGTTIGMYGTTEIQQLKVTGVSTFVGNITVDSGNIFYNSSSNQLRLLNDVPIYFGNSSNGYIAYQSANNKFHVRVPTGIHDLVLGAGPNVRITNNDGTVDRALFNSVGATIVGVVTATAYYGDASRVVSGKWTLGANGTSNYTFDGVGVNAGNNYNTPMYLARGCVYEFVNNSGGSHPFQIRVSNGGAAYSTGVTNNGASSGTIRFEVPMDAPNSLYYQCTAHSGMGGTITVYPDAVV